LLVQLHTFSFDVAHDAHLDDRMRP
jgi:hypothetical protein